MPKMTAVAAVIVVGLLAVSLLVLASPPPETVTMFMTLDGAVAATFTINVISG